MFQNFITFLCFIEGGIIDWSYTKVTCLYKANQQEFVFGKILEMTPVLSFLTPNYIVEHVFSLENKLSMG